MEPPPLPSAETPGLLDGRTATLILVFYLLSQFVSSLIAGSIGATIVRMTTGETDPATIIQRVTAPIYGVVFVISGAVFFALCRFRLGNHVRDTSPTGAAWAAGNWKQILQGAGLGVFAGCVYIGVSFLAYDRTRTNTLGPLAQMAAAGGVQRMVWVGLLLSAAFVEEPLFRGVLYGGYRRSLGPVWAAVLTTFVFWALHLLETMHFWPSMVAVGVMGIVALWIRLRTAAIGPAVALHLGYNGTVAVLVLYWMWRRGRG